MIRENNEWASKKNCPKTFQVGRPFTWTKILILECMRIGESNDNWHGWSKGNDKYDKSQPRTDHNNVARNCCNLEALFPESPLSKRYD